MTHAVGKIAFFYERAVFGKKKVKKLLCRHLTPKGIVKENDPYLYGEKVKAYLRRGARPLPGFDVYPNPQVGYGALCVRDSLPV